MLRKRGADNKNSQSESTSNTSGEVEFNVETGKKKRDFFGLKLLFLAIFLVVYVVIPFSVYLCPAIRRHAVFLNYISLSRQKNLSMPVESGLECARNFYIESSDNVQLGVWHTAPKHMCKDGVLSSSREFNDENPIVLYLHGNAGTRAGGHRVELYKLLNEKLGAHVVAFDYRGFGDSTNFPPSEPGLVQDVLHVYKWLLERADSRRITIWGHSLGTGVAVASLSSLPKSSAKPQSLILEAPFTSIIDAASHHPLSIFHRYMPFFDVLIAQPIGDTETGFDSAGRIDKVTCPLLILHAEDDGFVPYEQGKKLYEKALAAREKKHPHVTKFVGFDGELDHGHKNIYLNPDLPSIIQDFLSNRSPKPK